MSTYVVLARKWRPSQLHEVVGQSSVVQTLQNAFEFDRIHQAYLFTGSRGVGKTSVARIFAKLIRCSNLQKTERGLESCEECPSCLEMKKGSSVDVLEIDGASNNGVDAVREIREQVKYLPLHGSKKVYIIDEVHMLTTAAFNALLKTLEEPPEHLLFIFATTEAHKIPATILSRVQRFDFQRVPEDQVFESLKNIAVKENFKASDDALQRIAKASDGGMRDALSLMDQTLAYSGNELTLEKVESCLGLIPAEMVNGFLSAILDCDLEKAISLSDQAKSKGFDFKMILEELVISFHHWILHELSIPSKKSSPLSSEYSKKRPIEELEMIFQMFHYGWESLQRSPQPKVFFDLLLVKACHSEGVEPVFEKKQTNPTPKKESRPSPSTPQRAAPSLPQNTLSSFSASDALTYSGLIGFIKTKKPLLGSILDHAQSDDFEKRAHESKPVSILFSEQDEYFLKQLQTGVYQAQLKQLLQEYVGKPIGFELKSSHQIQSPVAQKEEMRKNEEKELKEKVQSHPIIQEAKALFGGELGEILIQSTSKETR